MIESGWFYETLNGTYQQRFLISRLIHHEKTEFQEIVIFETPDFGRVLALDGVIQTTQRDEFIYHEMLVHPAVFAHGAVKNVLIIGGGDGGALEETLKHDIASATLVDIDENVIALSKAHLPTVCGAAFDDPRTCVEIGDGRDFVEQTDARFDLIIVDSPDPIGPGEALFEAGFYAACRRCMRPEALLVTQSGVTFLQESVVATSFRRLQALFADVGFYVAPVPTYVGGFMAFGWATDQPNYRRRAPAAISRAHADSGIETRYYTPDIHMAAFALPGYIAAAMTTGD